MTRAEFVDSVTTWWELRDFCDDIQCDIMDGFMDSDSRDEYIDESLVDMARTNTWREMLDALRDYDNESGYEYYVYDEYYGSYRGVSDDEFEDFKQRVLEYADQNDEWEPEEEEEEPEEETVFTEDNSVPVPEEDCTFDDMFGGMMVA